MVTSPLRIGIIAPPWLPVPPPAYGGTELMIDALCHGLRRRGHDITLFTIGTSSCPVRRRWLFDEMSPDRMGAAVEEFRHVLAGYEALADVDVIHDHTYAGLFVGPLNSRVPIVTTVHGPFGSGLSDLYERTVSDVSIVAISHDQARRAPTSIRIADVIHHGIEISNYPFTAEPEDHVLFLGRMSPDKGVETAIAVARAAERPLLIAARLREQGELAYFRDRVEPLLGSQAIYVGEADFAEKVRLLSTATALVNPIRWPEPFGLVMAESLACGTPVIGGATGAAPEIVDSGRTGFLANDITGLVHGLEQIDSIERAMCRRAVVDRFTSDRMAIDYERLFNGLAPADSRPSRNAA